MIRVFASVTRIKRMLLSLRRSDIRGLSHRVTCYLNLEDGFPAVVTYTYSLQVHTALCEVSMHLHTVKLCLCLTEFLVHVFLLYVVVPIVWLEHTTYRLQGGCSTAELYRRMSYLAFGLLLTSIGSITTGVGAGVNNSACSSLNIFWNPAFSRRIRKRANWLGRQIISA